MIGSLVLTVALAASSGGSPDAMKKYQVKTLSLQAPASWERSSQEGTEKFKSPTGEVFFTLDVGAVQTAGMKADVCLDKILAAMGAEGWEKLKLGKNPAARRVNLDNANEAGSEKVRSITYVGCNGKTTWSMIFSGNDKKKDEFEPVVAKITQSVSYSKGK
ncbi:hypothetical protein [Hyalangium versicolor]|uniref:hypothetical protein n=1 Tax=Hyalangium versicolor TaxID=2861190 RepID=UPI001CCDF591|nr:hypothetical protein [Hyalangium versicolor]